MNKLKENALLRLVKETKPIAKWLALAAVLDVIAVLCAVAAPEILGQVVQTLIDNGNLRNSGSSLVSNIRMPLLVLLMVYGANGLMGYLNMLLMNNVVSKYYSCGFRIRLSEKIKRLPVKYVDQTPVGDILRRMTDDVSEMGGYVHQIFDTLIKGGFQIALISVAMFMEDWRLALFVVVLTPLSLLLSSKIAGLSEKHFDAMFDQSGKLTELVEESFSNFPTTKAYNLEHHTQMRHSKINEAVCTATVKANFVGSIVQPVIRLANGIAYIAINLIGGYLVVKQGVSVGVVVTIVLYARLFASPLEQLAYGFSQLKRVKAAAKRVFSILDMEEEDAGKFQCGAVVGSVEFKDVNFSYDPNKPLIQNLELHISPGQNVAIVGPTGAGKTTIVNLLMRFYDPDKGEILIDGIDTKRCTRTGIRNQIGMVLQDTWLIKGTIAENVAYGKPDATFDEIREACKKAHCHHFIMTLPDGYETIVGEDNAVLSGGQKQLITIARAILANKPLLILDEATSNVDTRTEKMIQSAMDTLMKGKTSFVIAHRLSTIVSADLILVLDHGRVVEQGTHKELMNNRGFYYQLYTSQYAI